MKILILNGSPRLQGTVVSLLKAVTAELETEHNLEWIDVCSLSMRFCTGCMRCRETGDCILPEDDAQRIGQKIRQADLLLIGTPTYWGNMSAPLKLLFDRTVPIFMGESPAGIPIPRQKGKKAVVVTACSTPWPFNVLCAESRGAIRAVKEVLHYGGYQLVGTLVQPGSKKTPGLSTALVAKAHRLGKKLRSGG